MDTEFQPTISKAVDTNLEETLLGTLLISPEKVGKVLKETKLKPSSFFHARNQAVWATILKLYDEGDRPEAKLVQSNLNGECPPQYTIDLISHDITIDE